MISTLLLAACLAWQDPTPPVPSIFVGPQGTTVTLPPAMGAKFTWGPNWLTLTWGSSPVPPVPPGPTPGPTPTPDPPAPVPPPPPTPKLTGTIHVVLISDWKTATQDLIALRNGLATADLGRDVFFADYDVSQGQVDTLNLRSAAAKAGVPCYLVLHREPGSATSTFVVQPGPPPKSAADVLAKIKQLRGN